jgi:hypothetical protein
MHSLLRAALALVAVLLFSWFAVLVRDDHIGREAADRLLNRPDMSDADFVHSLDQLRKAELLNPGTEWRVTRAGHLLLRDKRKAVRLAESVLRREPENLSAWVVVLNATRGRDPRRSSRAAAQIRRLNPSVPKR